jgi:hypothetical protein
MTIARTWQTAESTAFARKRERGRKALGESETEKRLFPNARPARRSYWPPTARKSSPHPEARPPQYEALEAAPASTRECAGVRGSNPRSSTKKSCSASVVPKAPKSRDLIKG